MGAGALAVFLDVLPVWLRYLCVLAFSMTGGIIPGALFAGVVGVGFYPIMGNRVWCRFGCPLAAYIGIVQRFRSRFRITTSHIANCALRRLRSKSRMNDSTTRGASSWNVGLMPTLVAA